MGPTSGGSPATARIGDKSRGQMSVIGLVIIIGITIVGMTTILAFGTSSITESQASSEVERAGQAMAKMDSKISFTALGSSEQQTVQLPHGQTGSTLSLEDDAGWMNISIRNASDNSVRIRVLNETMGAIVYENQRQDVTIAYQGGGVWRKEDTGTAMISPPEFHYRTQGGDPTLTLPLVVIKGSGTINGDVRVRKDGETISKYPDPASSAKSNPLTEGQVNITISSEYYRSWGKYFEDRTDGNVSYDHDREIVMISLVIPNDDDRTITNAIASTKAGDEMKLGGSGNKPSFVDSYNSSDDEYTVSKSKNGTIELAGDVEVTGNGEIDGDIRSGGDVEIKNNADIDGWVYWTTGFDEPNTGCPCDGSTQISGVESADSSTNKVLAKLDDLESSNSNDYADDISSQSLDSGDIHLNASDNGENGRAYYLDGDTTIQSGEKLTIDTSEGPVTLGVDGSLTVNGNITVTGGNRTEIWVGGSDVEIGEGGTVHVPNDISKRMWLYGTGNAEIDIAGSQSSRANFTGVVYAPSGPGETGTVLVQHANVWGALVVGQIDIKAYGKVHYDKALSDHKAFANQANLGSLPKITYLHISVNKVNVTDA